MFRRFYLLVLGCVVAGAASQASANDIYIPPPMFPNIAADFAMAQLHREVLDRKLEEQRRDGTPDASPDAAPSSQATLTYAPSPERRRANLAQFAARARASDPAGAAQMEQLFASTDIIEQVGAVLAPHNYSVDNLADAYAIWWLTAWQGAQGSNDMFSEPQMQSVQAQAQNALLAAPQLGEMSDAAKQQMAEAMLVQAVIIDSAIDAAKQQPDLMPQLKAAIREGAKASGLDLDGMVLTEEGFKPAG